MASSRDYSLHYSLQIGFVSATVGAGLGWAIARYYGVEDPLLVLLVLVVSPGVFGPGLALFMAFALWLVLIVCVGPVRIIAEWKSRPNYEKTDG